MRSQWAWATRFGFSNAISSSPRVSLTPHPTLAPPATGSPDIAASSTFRAAVSVLRAGAKGRLTRYEIAEESMLPTLRPGDWVMAERRPRDLALGDIVVFELRPGFEVVKRVSATPPGLEDGLWLLGDNPAAGSVDSRTLGPIESHRIRARVLLRYRPRPITAVR